MKKNYQSQRIVWKRIIHYQFDLAENTKNLTVHNPYKAMLHSRNPLQTSLLPILQSNFFLRNHLNNNHPEIIQKKIERYRFPEIGLASGDLFLIFCKWKLFERRSGAKRNINYIQWLRSSSCFVLMSSPEMRSIYMIGMWIFRRETLISWKWSPILWVL